MSECSYRIMQMYGAELRCRMEIYSMSEWWMESVWETSPPRRETNKPERKKALERGIRKSYNGRNIMTEQTNEIRLKVRNNGGVEKKKRKKYNMKTK